jgi:DNA-binding SARP family transcriptional activator
VPLPSGLTVHMDLSAAIQAYAQAMNLMQKLLGLKPKLTARDLCIQFGCAPVDLTVVNHHNDAGPGFAAPALRTVGWLGSWLSMRIHSQETMCLWGP